MAHQVLARKYRPKNFAEFVGQQHVVQALTNALTNNRLHHAYLLSGTRGVGKTTLGRILAKCFNCEQGVTATPCDQCPACLDINQAQSIDLIEIDAASNTKVEDTRDLLDNVPYRPARDRYKVYLIDEVHMLSKHSFNALLKTLEEPPEHVKFILATTDPQKLPITILSRCLQFHLKNMSVEQIVTHLTAITVKENIRADKEALLYIAQAADGSMRDALSLLDQSIAYSGANVTGSATRNMLGLIDNHYIQQLLLALQANNGNTIIFIIKAIAENGDEFYEVCNSLLEQLTAIAMAQVIPDSSSDANIKQLAQMFTPEAIQLYYQIALIGKRDLTLAPSAQSGFEMLMLRMLAFTPLEKAKPNLENNTLPPTELANASIPAASAALTATGAPAIELSTAEDWHSIIKQLNLTGVTAVLAQHSALKSHQEDKLILQVEPSHGAMVNEKLQQRLNSALNDYYGKAIILEIEVCQPANESIAAKQQRHHNEKLLNANQAIQADPYAQDILAAFGAQLIPESIISK